MENAVEALKIAGAVLLFVLALSLSISSLSQANTAVSTIATIYDKEAQYEYIKPSNNLTRTVGVETIVSTMYKAYDENIKIIFKDTNGNDLPIYYKTNQYGSRVDVDGKSVSNSDPNAVEVNQIDLSEEGFATAESATTHLSMILAGKEKWKNQYKNKTDEESKAMLTMLEKNKYGNQFMDSYSNGFYEFLSKFKFTESLGEYYQGASANGDSQNSSTNSTKIKKRVIVYQKVN